MWYRWTSESAFDTWHTAACQSLGIPHPNRNEATGEVDPDAQWTTAYTDVVRVGLRDWRAFVDDTVAATVPDGLGTAADPPPIDSDT